jgi:hypothetical protein
MSHISSKFSTDNQRSCAKFDLEDNTMSVTREIWAQFKGMSHKIEIILQLVHKAWTYESDVLQRKEVQTHMLRRHNCLIIIVLLHQQPIHSQQMVTLTESRLVIYWRTVVLHVT